MWCLTRRALHRHFPFPKQSARHRVPKRRGSLVAELDRPREESHCASSATSLTAAVGEKGMEKPSASNAFLSPSHFAKAASPCGDQTIRARAVPAGAARDEVTAQQTALRDMFDDSQRRGIRLGKDTAWLKEERRAFRQSHGRNASPAEVEPHVDVALAPVAALKLTKHLSPNSSARGQVVQSILLQQSVAQSKLVQSNAHTLFRCLRCFHVYGARPRTLLRDSVGHSWLEYDSERKRARETSRRPGGRKTRKSVGKQRAVLAADPRNCPKCGSTRAQWMMEYVHHSTHG